MIDIVTEVLATIASVLKIQEWATRRTKKPTRGHFLLAEDGLRTLSYEAMPLTDTLIDDLPDDAESRDLKLVPLHLRHIHYYDNHRQDSEVLVFFFHGLGLDQDDFYRTLLGSDLHAIAPTLYGFHPDDKDPVPLPFGTHARLMARFVRSKIADLKPRNVLLVGFSTGADMIMQFPDYLPATPLLKGLLLLDCNINRQTCFISSQLRRIATQGISAIGLAREISASAQNLSEWLKMNHYLVRVFSKFERRVEFLARFADEVYLQTPEASTDSFSKRCRDLLQWNSNIHFVFSGGEPHIALLREIAASRELHHQGDTTPRISWERATSHFELLEPEFLEHWVEDTLWNA